MPTLDLDNPNYMKDNHKIQSKDSIWEQIESDYDQATEIPETSLIRAKSVRM